MKNNIANLFGLGKLPFSASGASVIVLPIYFGINKYLEYPLYINCGVFLIVTLFSLIALHRNAEYSTKDPGEIVIDEFLGMHICLIIASTMNFIALAILFVLFRVFDILKIFPFNIIDKKAKGKFGLLADDIAIGIFLGVVYYFVNDHFKLFA